MVDGEDPDWAFWYAGWLIDLSAVPGLLGVKPVRSELVYVLVLLDNEYSREPPPERWEQYYARRIREHFAS